MLKILIIGVAMIAIAAWLSSNGPDRSGKA